jgi:three-Cys-motif partner protein
MINDFSTDDGLILPEVGSWAAEKHSKIGYYAALFASSMKNKWDCRVFIDLFAGAGKARIRDTGKIVPGSPLVALNLANPFDQYIFCEVDGDCASALHSRITQHFPGSAFEVLNVDANGQVDTVLSKVPKFGRDYKGLTFCFVDPFNTQNLKFTTLRRIAEAIYVDFMILIPSYMDIKRNEHTYTQPSCRILDDFLGSDSWRADWVSNSNRFRDFGVFVADQFGKQMARLNYHYTDTEEFETVRMGQDRSLYLYHLGFFSRDPLGVKFWRETRERTATQLPLL